MSRKITIYTAVLSIFLTAQFASAEGTPNITNKFSSKKLLNKSSKLLGDLTTLRDNWELSQNNQNTAFSSPNSLLNIVANYVVVDAVSSSDGNAQALAKKLQSMGMRNIAVYGKIVSGQLPLDSLNSLSSVNELGFVRPAYAMANVGDVTSQGDVSMRTDVARNTYNIDGTGVTIGTLSDSYNCLGGAAGDVITGDLPSGVVVLEEISSCPGAIDEGRAMMQLIHDVAPGSDLLFHSAFNGMANFAQGIQDLVNAGADVVVDDIFYFAEPFFQDGIVAQSADAAVAAGVPYYTSAGNSARDSYESAYSQSGISIPALPANITLHDFDPGVGVDNLQQITVPIGARLSLSFQWDQPFFSVSGSPGATTDMDIYITDATGTNIIAISEDNNIGGDPVEVLVYTNTSGSSNLNLAINKFSGPDPTFMKYIGFRNLTINEYDTDSSTAAGHSNAANAVSVGAAYYLETPEFGQIPPLAENFSSAGGTPILFDIAGNPVNITRNNPDIVAPDGTNNTFFGGDAEPDGFPNFFGTSAAAPHAAAAAALMLEFNNSFTPAIINSLMESTAIDMDVAGYDFNTGYGLINIEAAIASYVPPLPSATTTISPSGTITDTTPTYAWNAVSNSTWYYLWVDDSTGNKIKTWHTKTQAGCASGTGTCSITPTTALASGPGTVWVQTWNNEGFGPWSTAIPFTVAAGPPPAAALISPTGTISDTTPTYSWNAVSSSTWYNLWVDDSTGNKIKTWYTATEAGCANGTGSCSITPTTVLASGASRAWVQTWNSEGYGPWSTGMPFTVDAGPPPAATIISPAGTITDTTPAYTWDAVLDSTWYYLWVDDSTGNKIKIWYTAAQANCSSGSGICSITPTTVLANGAGTWWIKTYSAAGNGPWSAGKTFTVSPPP